MIDTEKTNVLIIDDESWVRNLLFDVLKKDFHCETASSAEEGLSLFETKKFNLVLCDIKMDGMSGLELIPLILSSSPDTVVIMISGELAIESAIEAMRVGAFDFIPKPFNINYLEAAVQRAVDHQKLLKSKRLYERSLEDLIEERTNQLDYLTYHDALTGLPNRVLFEDRVNQALIFARQNKQKLAVIFLTIDRFNKINETLGHQIGDKLLIEAADRLKKGSSEGVTVARFESAKFAVLLPQINNTNDVIGIVNKYNEALNLPFIIGGHELFTTVSMGIGLFPGDGDDIQTLLKNTCTAIHRVKDNGGNSYQFYTTDMNSKALEQLKLENNLRRAIERGEFEVFYQPKINLEYSQICGMEALVRWRHPDLGLISPAEFIPLAEETGLIIPLGEWVLTTACRQNKSWQDEGFAPLRVSVNVSTRQFQQQNFSEIVTNIIGNTRLDPRYLELEITESVIMQDMEFTEKTLSKLRDLGVEITIDDFGTGYSSLGYLKRLPVDVLKIDRSFIKDLAFNAEDAALVKAIITLAHNLRMKVIVEGVETKEQLQILELLECDEWQGFLYSKPLPAEDFKELLLKGSALKIGKGEVKTFAVNKPPFSAGKNTTRTRSA